MNQLSTAEITLVCQRVLNVNAKGVLGRCGASAMAINRVFFDDRGRYFVMLDRAVFQRYGVWLGHVAVEGRGQLYDAHGEFDWRSYSDWQYALGRDVGEPMDFLPTMSLPPTGITSLGSALCVWADAADVKKAFVDVLDQDVPSLVETFRAVLADPNLGLKPHPNRAFAGSKAA